jgi:MFS family permease
MLNSILLLSGVFLLGVGFAINAPAWTSLVPQVVTDQELPSALTLSGVQMNISSILGPALAGLVLAKIDAPFVFGRGHPGANACVASEGTSTRRILTWACFC